MAAWKRYHPAGPRPGFLLVIEGIDGSGKSTQVRALADHLRAAGVEVVQSREPTDGPWGRLLRDTAAVGRRLAPRHELQAFLEDRREHVQQVIAPALTAGRVVVLDRYYFSTIAYQGARGWDVAELQRQSEAVAPAPDLLVILAIDPDEGLARIAARGGAPDAFERRDELARAAAIFAAVDEPYLLRLDARRPPAELTGEIVGAVLARRSSAFTAQP